MPAKQFMVLDLDKIVRDPEQPRKAFDVAAMTELSQSIAEHGVLQPILVRPTKDGKYMIVAGERRVKAARNAGLDEIPAMIDDGLEGDDEKSFEIAMIENVQRKDLDPIEVAKGYRKMLGGGMTFVQVAKKMGVSDTAVRHHIALLNAPEAFQAAAAKGGINYGDWYNSSLGKLKMAWCAEHTAAAVLRHGFGERGIWALARFVKEELSEDMPPGSVKLMIEQAAVDIANGAGGPSPRAVRDREVRSGTPRRPMASVAPSDAEEKFQAALDALQAPLKPAEWDLPEDNLFVSEHGTPVLLLSDFHFGEVVSREQTGGANEFDSKIAVERIKRITSRVTKITHHVVSGGGHYEEIVVALLGDMVSGLIHEELRETNDAHIADSATELAEHLIAMFEVFREHYKRVRVYCVVGNHGRWSMKPRAKGAARDSWDYVVYNQIARYFAGDEDVAIHVPNALQVKFAVEGLNFLAIHGDSMRGGHGNAGVVLPHAIGASRLTRQAQSIATHVPGADAPHDVLVLGHCHTYYQMENRVANGSLKGLDEFAFKSGFSYEPPQQALFFVTRKRGITLRCPVFAGE